MWKAISAIVVAVGLWPAANPQIQPAVTNGNTPVIESYVFGNADALVAELARTLPDDLSQPFIDPDPRRGAGASEALSILLATEVGMRKGTFGRYAASAPFHVAPSSVGLTGYFELNSFRTYRAVETLLERARAESAPTLVDVTKDWYIVAVSYCMRWHLDCGDALLAKAEQDFTDPEIDLLSGAVAETLGASTRAETRLRRALSARATQTEAKVRLGRVLLLRGRLADARQIVTEARDEARASRQWFGMYFGERLLEQLDERAGRLSSARAHAAEAAKLQLPVTPVDPKITSTDAWALYRAAQFWQFTPRIEEMRRTVRQ